LLRQKSKPLIKKKTFSDFLEFLTQAVSLHLIEQVKSGVQAIQLFDTWAGLCPASHFEKWILQPTQKVIKAVKDVFPTLPIIGFPKGIGVQLVPYAEKTGITGLSLDASTPLSWATQELPQHIVLQGNLDPLMLVSGGAALKREIASIHEKMKERPYIFNLGHGILPQTPLENVEDCVKWVRELK
jgi:uroporphyrinogen decarboxylase